MTLVGGTRLGPYEILSALGAGGMGEVYKARDTQLKRDVALKILPSELVLDPDPSTGSGSARAQSRAERLARFDREAQALAALNHPHIAQIYGFAHEGDVRGIAMELVEGPTLAERIARGPLPLDEVIPLAIQLADALEYAHDHGIVHRDLKPANIKLTPDGAVKVLDFGLAKALAPAGASATADLTNSPTVTSPAAMTRVGVILGTAAYMAPEQARGAAVDKRADIWAFGVVLFEMLTGKACFAGDTVTDVLAAVVKTEPDWSALPAATPWRLRELLGRCLTKDRKWRLHDIGDARIELEEIAAGAGGGPRSRTETPSAARAKWAYLVAALSVLALAGGAAAVFSGIWPPPRASSQQPWRLSIIHTEGDEVGAPSISPDGTRVAYRARGADGVPRIWIRRMDDVAARPVPNTEDGYGPFWSPDSRQVGFFASLWLFTTSVDGGQLKRLAIGSSNGGGTWGPGGTIVFTRRYDLCRIQEDGSRQVLLTNTQLGRDWTSNSPSFLPDGRHFLFTARQDSTGADSSNPGVYVGSLDLNERSRLLLPERSNALYASPGHILFARDGTLMAAAFDPASNQLRPTPPVALGESVAVDQYDFAAISASHDGVIAIRPPPARYMKHAFDGGRGELCVLNRDGSGRRLVGGVKNFSGRIAIEPNGRRAAVTLTDPRSGVDSIWLVALDSGAPMRLSTGDGTSGWPVWSPSGDRIAFALESPGAPEDVYVKSVSTSALERIITGDATERPLAWSRDGQSLLVFRMSVERPGYVLSYSFASRKAEPFVARDGAAILDGVFSPDGRYVAYSSNESGRFEVYVTTFPNATEPAWQLTTQGARTISWGGPNGDEILVGTLSGDIAAYPVSTAAGGFSHRLPTTLIPNLGSDVQHARATPDHKRIVVRVYPDELKAKDRNEMRLLSGWQHALGSR